MEYLGYIFDSPERDETTGNWNPVEITFDEQESFNGATSKLIKVFKHPDGDGKCIVTDSESQKYMLDITHVTFDTQFNSIRVFPTECRKMK